MTYKSEEEVNKEFEEKFGHKEMIEIITGTKTEVKDFISSLRASDLEHFREWGGKKMIKLPHEPQHCQNRNGIDYCGTCEQAWEDCSCPARNTGYKKALSDLLTHIKELENK